MASAHPPSTAPLSDHQLFVLEMAGAIVAGHARQLAATDLEVLAEASRLLTLHGREAPITERHWTVVGPTVAFALAGGQRPELRSAAA